MNKYLILIGSLFILSSFSELGATTIDSLKSLLPKANQQQKVDILNNLGWELKYENTDDALKYSMEAHKLALSLKYSKGIAVADKNLAALSTLTNKGKEAEKYADEGILYATALRDTFTLAKLYNIKALVLEDKYSYSKAIWYFTKSFQLFDKIGDKTEATGILNNLALLYGEINEKKLELETYIRVIKIEEQAGNKFGLARTYNNIAGLYNSLGDIKTAHKFYIKGLAFSRETSSDRYESAALNGLGLIQRDLQQTDSAIYYLNKAVEINKRNNYLQWLGNNYLNLGNIKLFDQHRINEGEQYLSEACKIYLSIDDWNNYIIALNVLCEQNMRTRNYKKVASLIQTAENYSDRLGSSNILRDYSLIKYNYYKSTGQTSLALKNLELVAALNDSIRSKQKELLSYELQAKYDLEREEQENEKLKITANLGLETIRKQKIAMLAIVIISLLLIYIIFLVIKSRSRIKKANKALNEITHEIREKAQELQLANESKDKFLSIISHDLKNPISAVTGLSELILDGYDDLPEEEKYKYLKYINDGCQSADQLLENLMKWVRTQTGKMELKPIAFDVSESVNEAIKLVKNAAIRKDISISNHIQPGTMVMADHEMLNTCIINLVSNAVKFTPNNGTIMVSPEINASIIKIKVKDSGVGISPDNLGNLFRLDVKSGTLGTANEKGTGLGLLLVKEFIEKNNGEVIVESKPGEGSTFTLSIPKAQMLAAG